MNKSTLTLHGLWAVAAVVAFCIGSALQNGGESSTPIPDSTDAKASPDPRRSSGRAGAAAPESSSKRVGDRAGERLLSRFGANLPTDASIGALVEQAVKNPNPISRRVAFSRLLEELTAENALEIREQLVEAGLDDDEWRDFNYAWGALAGREAFDFAAESEERDMEATLAGWASANPSEALALLDNLPENLRDQRNDLAASVVSGLADNDPALATELVLRLENEGNDRADRLIRIVANEQMRGSSPAEAALWSESLPEGRVKGSAMDRVAEEYAESDPEAAAQWAQQFADRDYGARIVAEVADEWAERDPVTAVTWLQNLPTGDAQNAGMRTVFGDWEDRDPVAAGEYLMSMPPSGQRDAAISGFSRGYAWQDPQTAIAWAQDIADPSLRAESLTRAGQVYFRRDPDSARAWLESSELPPETRDAILNPPRRRQ